MSDNTKQTKEILIGRSPESTIKIPEDRDRVSSRHIKIRVSENGVWTLEDLQSTNGTYVRDDDGRFHRVYTKQISESDIIRLGNGGASSFTFMAHRVLNPTGSYAFEFQQLRHAFRDHISQEEKKEKRIEIAGWVNSCTAAAVFLITWAFGLDIMIRFVLMSVAPILGKFLFSGDSKELKELRKKRERLFRCPKCGSPISPFDIEAGQCSRCKAQ